MDRPEYRYDEIDVYEACMEHVDAGELVLILDTDPAKMRVCRYGIEGYEDVFLSEDRALRAQGHASLAFHAGA